jgi:glycosyltransferase involved in cell wall biosynthesis
MTNNKPRVNIGVPVFNGEEYLADALNSLLRQTYSDFEIIISDNASTDNTQNICLSFAERDKRIRYYRSSINLGNTENFNRVFELSSCIYFKWAAHDDICEPQLLERCVEILDKIPFVVLCYPKTRIINEYGQFVYNYDDEFDLRSSKPSERFKHILGANRLLNPVFGLMRTNTLKTTQLHKAYAASDRVFLGEMALRGMFFEIPEYLFNRRIHPQKSTVVNKTDAAMAAYLNPLRKKQVSLPRWRRFWEFLISIRRAKMPISEQLRCYMVFAQFYIGADRWRGIMRDFFPKVERY